MQPNSPHHWHAPLNQFDLSSWLSPPTPSQSVHYTASASLPLGCRHPADLFWLFDREIFVATGPRPGSTVAHHLHYTQPFQCHWPSHYYQVYPRMAPSPRLVPHAEQFDWPAVPILWSISQDCRTLPCMLPYQLTTDMEGAPWLPPQAPNTEFNQQHIPWHSCFWFIPRSSSPHGPRVPSSPTWSHWNVSQARKLRMEAAILWPPNTIVDPSPCLDIITHRLMVGHISPRSSC